MISQSSMMLTKSAPEATSSPPAHHVGNPTLFLDQSAVTAQSPHNNASKTGIQTNPTTRSIGHHSEA